MTATDQIKLPLVLGISGASGAVYGFSFLKFFLQNNFKVDLVLSKNAVEVALHELELNLKGLNLTQSKETILEVLNCGDFTENLTLWDEANIAANISSGSYKTQGMIIAPCSMGTLANIAAGTSNNLLARAADVTLKERRKLILVVRETPLNTIHLRNMCSLSEIGAVILPAAPGFYQKPKTIQDQVNFILGKTLDVVGIDNELFKRWTNS